MTRRVVIVRGSVIYVGQRYVCVCVCTRSDKQGSESPVVQRPTS